MKIRPYIFFDQTTSLCTECYRKIDAKIIFENNRVYMLKRCPEHGKQKTLISTDIEYYKRSRDYMKASEMPVCFNTRVDKGCPFDCGLCEDHEQHSCLSLVEITENCNMACPVCYAKSGKNGQDRSLNEIRKMLDIIVKNEGTPDVVQISGGEPTMHPDFFQVLVEAKKRPIKHLMVNTNGLRIAEEEGFAEKLSEFMPGFELYLQFDSLNENPLKYLRGKNLVDIHDKILTKLDEFNISTTLVVTLKRGLNDNEIGDIISYALKHRSVRGITFQPVQEAGRLPGSQKEDKNEDPLTISEIRNEILKQSSVFQPQDLVPVPCHPDAICMGYALKVDDDVYPLTRYVSPEKLLEGSGNTIVFERDEKVKKNFIKLFSTGCSPGQSASRIKDLLCCLPKIQAPGLKYDNIFRVMIMRFMDARDFDVRSIKKSCVHIVHKNGRMIPFETMNLFYRDE